MKVLLAAFLALGGLVVAAPAASAGGAGAYFGGCMFETFAGTGDTYEGVIAVRVLTTDSYVPPLPAAATVSCSLTVDGVEQNPSNHLVVTGSGVEAGAQPTTFTATTGQVVQVCTTVRYLDVAGATDDTYCPSSTPLQVPPQQVIDTLDTVVGGVDHASCPVLAQHAGTYGPVTIAPDGSVTGPDPLGNLNPYDDCSYLAHEPDLPPPPDPQAASCPYGQVTGTAAYAPALAATVAPHTEAFDLTATGCVGTSAAAGGYTFHLRGSANDACTGAYPAITGGGTLTGAGPGGALSGTYAITKAGTRYWVRGRFASNGRTRYVDLWLDQPALCPVASSGLVGDAAVFG